MNWQPIETAPKNCEILGWRQDRRPFICRWGEGINLWQEMPTGLFRQPTHWLPITDPLKSVRKVVGMNRYILSAYSGHMKRDDAGEYVEYADHLAALSAKDAEIAELRKDALRYRWARSERGEKDEAAKVSELIQLGKGAFAYELPSGEKLDSAIDSLMSTEQPK